MHLAPDADPYSAGQSGRIDDAQRWEAFVARLPKAELHVHLEGCIEPAMMFELARRNGLSLRWDTPETLRAAYQFANLQAFLDLYFEGCRVLVQERDFYDVTLAYLRRAHADGVVRAEMFIGPQSFTDRGISVATVMQGVLAAMQDAAAELGISAGLLVSAHRHRSETAALEMLESVMPWADRIAGIGMGGAEVGNPPSKFVNFFRTCRKLGFRATIHAGEEGPASYVREAIDLLEVDRIDHGIACMDDPVLVRDLAERAIPLTVCPLSNLRLNLVPSHAAHPLRAMLDSGLLVSVHSDDPPYFGGYIADNLNECRRSLGLDLHDIAKLARNSFTSAFVPTDEAARGIAAVDAWCARISAAAET
jgi:adenosine deaminase